jgi:hypothetical protein
VSSRETTLASLLSGAFSKKEMELLQSHPQFRKALERAQDEGIEEFEYLCTLGNKLLEDEPRRRNR